MSGTTSVPAPTFGLLGFIAPEEADILAGVQADMNAAFGGDMNPALDTPQGQLASSLTAIIGDKNDQFLRFTNQVDPAFAEGRMQDAIGRIYFIERNPAEPTAVQATCLGLAGTVIPQGALAQALDGNIYVCTQAGVIPVSGSISLPFACQVYGPIACPAGSLSIIYQTIPGWDSITNPADGSLGNLVESPAAFEERRSASVALNGRGSIQSIRGAVLSLPNVLDVYAVDNASSTSAVVGGVTLAPHSIYVAVVGGEAQAIANAIWTKKDTGASYNGNTGVIVYDNSYEDPKPTYQVLFQIPTPTEIFVRVRITASTRVPSDAAAKVDTAVVQALFGADGGSRAKIGSTIYASRFYALVARLGAWAQIIDIQVSLDGTTWTDTVSLRIDQSPVTSASNVSLVLV